MIRFGLLGPATAWHEGREVDLGSPQQRTLFAALLLHRNEPVTTDRLVDALWPAGAPPNAVQAVRTYVSRLRGGPLGWADLVTHRQGYELRAASGEVDVDRLESRVAAARGELTRGDAVAAEAVLTEALALMRGPPLPELRDDAVAAAERTRVDELCAGAEDELVEARLAQGLHLEILPLLRAAVTAQPLRERSWEQLMVALYRSGRQAEALAAYRGARRALGEFGLEPGATLRALERMILLQDPALELPQVDEPCLPRPRTTFLGRESDVAAVESGIAGHRLVTIVGPAGVGKTRLAAEVLTSAGARLGVRVWWVDLARAGATRVAAATARALAVPQVPGRPAADLIVVRLQETPAVLVLDNCEHVLEESAQLAATLLSRDPRIRVLATSREPLRVAGEQVHRLAGLADEPATRLLLDRAGSAHHDPEAIADVIVLLDGLPLALELAAGKLRSISAAALSRGLRERLWLLTGGDRPIPLRQRTLETAIAWSHEILPVTEQRVLRRLAVFAGGFDAAIAEAVAARDGVDRAAVLPALAHLVDDLAGRRRAGAPPSASHRAGVRPRAPGGGRRDGSRGRAPPRRTTSPSPRTCRCT